MVPAKKSTILDYVIKNRTPLLIAAIALVIFHKYIVLISLAILLGMIGLSSFKVSRYVPHISVESVTASSVLLGFLYGWKIGMGFGIVFGLYGYANNSMIKLKSIINSLLMGICGVIASIFAALDYSFLMTYMLTFAIRIALNFMIFPLVEPDMFENTIHGLGDPLFNMMITFQFMNILYGLLSYFMLI